MAKKTNKSANGTSFHFTTIVCSPNELTKILGNPTYEQNTGEDKINLEWICETEDGKVFTIYDWKEYRTVRDHEEIEWHIGGHNGATTMQAYHELVKALDTVGA